jgi:tetratricopeptide (TPR) repeat protein
MPAAAGAADDWGAGGGGVPQARGPAYDPNKELHAGIAALQAERFRAAKQNFEHVLVMIPDQPLALSMLGQSEAGLGDLKGAARDYEASLRADPTQVVPARELAIVDEKLGRHDAAATQLVKLKTQEQACNQSCPGAGDLDAAIAQVEAVMSSSGQTASPPAKLPAT